MSSKLRIGIIGSGGIAQGCHMPGYAALPDLCEMVAVCDANPDVAKTAAEKFGIEKTYSSYSDMLANERLDAVSVATPNAFHLQPTVDALKAGVHVLCEKPLAMNAEEARQMCRAARDADKILMVGLQNRFGGPMRFMRDFINHGHMGDIYYARAQALRRRGVPGWGVFIDKEKQGGGPLIDIGVHILDMAMFVLGPMASVNCRLKTFDKIKGGRIGEYVLDANDSAVIHAEAKNGATGVVHTSRWATGHYNTLLLRAYGDQGAIVVNLDKSGSEIEVCKGRDARKAQWKTLKCPAIPRIHERFLAGIRSGRQDQPSFEDGAAVQQVLDACFASDEAGSSVKIR